VKRIFVSIAAATAAVLASVGLFAGVASAHQANITGETTCLDDGAWTVRWTVGNSETAITMTIDSAAVNGASISLSPNPVPGSGSATGTSPHSAASASATLSVNSHWSDGVTNSDQATVNKPEDCVASTTTTTTEAATTTTEAATTTTVVASTTTVQVEGTTVVTTPVTTPAPQVEAAEVSNALPVTGAVSLPLVISGASLLLVGVGLVVVARRRGVTV
jgi:hypothetical protein